MYEVSFVLYRFIGLRTIHFVPIEQKSSCVCYFHTKGKKLLPRSDVYEFCYMFVVLHHTWYIFV